MLRTKKCSCCHKINPDPKGKAIAMAEAKKALALMTAPGWKIDIFHNINWVWYLNNAYITVYPVENGQFYAMMGDYRGGGGGLSVWTPSRPTYFRDPNKAARAALKAATSYVRALDGIIFEQRERLRHEK